MNKLIVTVVTVAFVLITSVSVSAHHMGQPQGMMGQGMMGGGMMGGGMMGGGMMGGGMMGQGMNRLMAIHTLSLSDDQLQKVINIKSDLRKANWGLMGAMMDHRDRLTELYLADNRDANAISGVYGEIFKLKQQMIKNALDADSKAYALLDDEQRKQLKQGSRSSSPMGSGRHHMMMNN